MTNRCPSVRSSEGYVAALQEADVYLDSAKTYALMIFCLHCGTGFGPFSRVGREVQCGRRGKAFALRQPRNRCECLRAVDL